MLNIADILKNKDLESPIKTAKSERAELTKQIDDIHHSVLEHNLRKKENWKRYCAWCKKNKLPDTTENQSKFKKTKECIKEQKSLWFLVSHIKTKDLYYIISMMKDSNNRGKSASAWLLSNLSIKKNENNNIK